MTIVNGTPGFTQLTKLNVTEILLEDGNPVLAGDISLLVDGEIPQAVGGILTTAGVHVDQTTGVITFDNSIVVPSGSITVGEVLELSEGVADLVLVDLLKDQMSFSVNSEFTDATGSDAPTYVDYGSPFVLDINLDDSETLTDNPLTFSLSGTVVAPDLRLIDRITIRAASAMTNFAAKLLDNASGLAIRYIPSKTAFEGDEDACLDLIAGDNIFYFASNDASTPGNFHLGFTPFVIEEAQQIDFTVKADSIAIKGDLAGIPYMVAEAHDGAPVELGATDPAGVDTSIQFNDGGVFGGDANLTYVTAPLYNDILLKPPTSSGYASFGFNNSSGANRGTFGYSQPSNELLYTVNASTTGGLRWVNNSEANLVFDNTENSARFEFVSQNHTQAHPMFEIGNSVAETDWFVGSGDPTGDVSATGGSFYFRSGEADSSLYVKRSSGAASTSGWVDLIDGSGDVVGPATSTDLSFPIWDGATGKLLADQGYITYEAGGAFYSRLHIKSPGASGIGAVVFDNSGGTTKGTFSYGQPTDQLIFTCESGTSGGWRWANDSSGDTHFSLSETSTAYVFDGTNHTDSDPLFNFATDDGESDIYVGTDTPVGNVSATGGSFYFRDDEADSTLYVKRSSGAASTSGWTNLIDGNGDVVGPASATDNAIVRFDSTTGKLIKDTSSAILTDDGTDLLLALNTPADGGLAEIIIYDNTSSERIKISHDDGGGGTDSTQIYMEALTNEIVGSGLEFTVRADNGDLLLHADTADKSVELKSAGPDTNAVIKIEAEGTNGVEVDFYTGDRTPVGNVTANPGDYYFRSSGATSDIYIHTGASADNTSWLAIVTSSGTGDVVGPASSVTNSIATFSDTTGKLIGGVDSARIVAGASNTTLHMEAIGATGSAEISLYDNTPTLQALIGFDSDTNDLFMMAIESGSIVIQSEDNLTLRAGHADSAPLLKLENDTEAIDLYVHDGNPNGTVSSLEGSLVVDTTSGGAQLYHQQGSGSGNSYAQIESFQKRHATVTSTSTLSRNYNRILLNPSADITTTLPTNASTAQADGFEQALIKIASNDDVITIPSPGFIAGSGNYVMSREGDTLTYLQTSSSNYIVNERRNVYAAMSFSGSQSIDGEGSSVDVEIDCFTSNDHSYYGLCESNYVQNRIDFPDVEDLINGDLYEVTINIVAKWENNYDVFFKSSVYDKGIWFDYPIHLEETSSSDNDYQQLNGQGTFRTGVNATAPGLDTYLTLVMRLSSNADITFKSINMHISKLRG